MGLATIFKIIRLAVYALQLVALAVLVHFVPDVFQVVFGSIMVCVSILALTLQPRPYQMVPIPA